MHEVNAGYGTSGHVYAKLVEGLARAWSCRTILDYGAGKGTLKQSLPHLNIAEYDPAVPGKDAAPEPADLVVCNDVLEHIERDCIQHVLKDIWYHTRKIGFLVVDLFPAVKFLPDGRNAHILLETEDRWKRWIGSYFEIITCQPEDIRKLLFIVRGCEC